MHLHLAIQEKILHPTCTYTHIAMIIDLVNIKDRSHSYIQFIHPQTLGGFIESKSYDQFFCVRHWGSFRISASLQGRDEGEHGNRGNLCGDNTGGQEDDEEDDDSDNHANYSNHLCVFPPVFPGNFLRCGLKVFRTGLQVLCLIS